MIRTLCPVDGCPWFHDAVATPPPPDFDPDVPPWCLSTWAVVPSGYGAPLTDAEVVGAHVATHTDAERSGRMPSRAEVEALGAPVPRPRTTAEHIEFFITPEGRRMVEEFMAEPCDDGFDIREVLTQNLDDALAGMVGGMDGDCDA